MLIFNRLSRLLCMGLLFALFSVHGSAQTDAQPSAVNPLRLSYTTGSVSFWRYGAEDWVEARINTPIISGDGLYTGANAVFELQGEGRKYVRADANTELTVVNQTPNFLQLKVAGGRVSLDIHTLPVPGYNIEINTPNAVFTIDRTGYYRVDVNGDVHFITRRGGAATMTQARGQALIILPSEQIVVRANGHAETYAAPEPDAWDRWNDERSNYLIDAYSDRYISPGIAGARDLDYYGNWRTTVEYGAVWVPDAMPYGWAPYTTGRWVWDPYYQWTWIDDMPWGWAPYHYGRWVYYGGYWAWAPGPVMRVRPVYAPALVAFFGVSFGSPGFGWVALGWGEPCVPWWGYRGFVGKPWWGGWGGPRLVNRKHVHSRTVININNITYSNSKVPNAIITTSAEHFGRHHMRDNVQRLPAQSKALKPMLGALPVKPDAGNLVADAPRVSRPPEQVTARPVVVNKRPQEARLPWQPETRTPALTEQRYVPAQKTGVTELRRPEPGTQFGPERSRPPLPSRYEDWKQQTSPAPSSATVREPGVDKGAGSSAGNIAAPGNRSDAETRQNRYEPRTVTEPPRWSQPAAPATGTLPAPRQQQLESTIPQSPRGGRDSSTQVPVTLPEAVPVMPQSSRGGRDSSVPVRIAPQERWQPVPAEASPRAQRFESMPQAEQPRGGRAELPGVPANRTFGDGNPGRSDYGRSQQTRPASGMPDQGRSGQGLPSQGKPQR